MRIPEENCNMILLAAVTLVGLAVAGSVALLEPATAQQTAQAAPAYLAELHTGAGGRRAIRAEHRSAPALSIFLARGDRTPATRACVSLFCHLVRKCNPCSIRAQQRP